VPTVRWSWWRPATRTRMQSTFLAWSKALTMSAKPSRHSSSMLPMTGTAFRLARTPANY
jgi:hypothetical protein